MLIYWLLSCQLFLFWGGAVCRLLLALPLLQIMLMSIMHKQEECILALKLSIVFVLWRGGVQIVVDTASPSDHAHVHSHKLEEWNTIREAGNPLPLATSITNIGKGWTTNMNKWFMVHPFPMSIILVARGRGFPTSRMVFHSFGLCRMDISMIWRRGSVNSNLHPPSPLSLPQNKNNWLLKGQYVSITL